jgi:MFS family permease
MTAITRTFKSIPRHIWALGFVSMFMDISSEMIHSLLPIFLVTVLGSSAIYVGLIEGVAEATALITRAFSGALSDWLGKRKALALTGYLLGTLTKPLFAMATGVGLVFTARFLDRIGKGIRGAPRDAMVADIVPPDLRGAAYGLRQSLDTVGALLGPVLAIFLMVATAGDFRSVFWVAVVPGLLAVSILGFGVQEPPALQSKPSRSPISVRDIMGLSHAYWLVVAFGSVLTLARFSEAFLLLRAENVGVTAYMVPIMLALMNLVYALTAYPVGRLSDRIGRTGLLAAGLVVLIASDLILAIAETGWGVAIGSALWGLQMGLTQGLLAAMVADTAHPDLRGTAFGVFSMATGIAMLFASLLAGWLWDAFGPEAAFLAGACFAVVALVAYPVVRRKLNIQ